MKLRRRGDNGSGAEDYRVIRVFSGFTWKPHNKYQRIIHFFCLISKQFVLTPIQWKRDFCIKLKELFVENSIQIHLA